MTLAVDEDGWRAVHTVRHSRPDVSFDAVGESVSVERRPKRNRIHAGLSCSALETSEIELVLVGEQPVVHDPEGVRSLQRIRGFGRFRSLLGMRMNVAEREVAKDGAKRIGIEPSQSSKR
jgi:hypothetical protein